MRTSLKLAALSLALPGAMAVSVPASAAVGTTHAPAAAAYDTGADSFQNRYDRYDRYDRNRDGRYRDYGRYDEPVYRNTRTWRGNDGRYYCKKKDGTTGLIIGGAAGALLGREIAGRGDNTLGTILGGVGGALLGREIDRNSGNNRRCR